MQTLKKHTNKILTAMGIYLILSPFTGFPVVIENAIYVFLGATVLWFSINGEEGKTQ